MKNRPCLDFTMRLLTLRLISCGAIGLAGPQGISGETGPAWRKDNQGQKGEQG